MKAHCGILDGNPAWDEDEARILVNTSGIPIEWIYAALSLSRYRRRKLRAMIRSENSIGNAESIEQGDGWKMLLAVCPNYSGPVPLWSQLELRNDRRSDLAIAQELGVHRLKVRRWRTNPVFDPLTGQRLVRVRGRQVAL